jgi:hypothetical protein
MQILFLNLDHASTQQVTQALSGRGYEITIGSGLSVDEILGLSAGVLIAGSILHACFAPSGKLPAIMRTLRMRFRTRLCGPSFT